MAPITTVRYHRAEDGTYWAEAGNWSGVGNTLTELRAVALQAVAFMHEAPMRTHAYFEITDATVRVDPVATEEFWPAEMVAA